MRTLKKLLGILSPDEKIEALLLILSIIVMAILDTAGVASIMPFMSLLANPDAVKTNTILKGLYDGFGYIDQRRFLLIIGMAVLLILLASLSFKAYVAYRQLRFTMMRESSISARLLRMYISQSYVWLLVNNGVGLVKVVTSEVGYIINYGLTPMLVLISQSAAILAISAVLVFIDPVAIVSSVIVIGCSYFIIFKATREFLSRSGSECAEKNEECFVIVNEALSAFKEVKICGLEEIYINRFDRSASDVAKYRAKAQAIGQLPRFALEGIAFGGMISLSLYLMGKNGEFSETLPVISVYAFAGYRLMPAIQQLYSSVTQLKFIGPALDRIYSDLNDIELQESSEVSKRISVNKSIEISDVSFTYPNSQSPAIKDIDIKIAAKTTVGFVGSSGSGKTTVVDVLLGLLVPEEGLIKVDGRVINETNRRIWQKSIGYVPQQTYLSNDTISANIAFGDHVDDIDQEAVERAAIIANLHDFIVRELPMGYQTIVGERGIRLSGGQKQRIAIARAVYRRPQVLVFDEATSALDNLTELEVIDAINNLSHEVTIIIIAHRLSAVKSCDSIYLFDRGRIVSTGRYDDLMSKCPEFRALVGGS